MNAYTWCYILVWFVSWCASDRQGYSMNGWHGCFLPANHYPKRQHGFQLCVSWSCWLYSSHTQRVHYLYAIYIYKMFSTYCHKTLKCKKIKSFCSIHVGRGSWERNFCIKLIALIPICKYYQWHMQWKLVMSRVNSILQFHSTIRSIALRD